MRRYSSYTLLLALIALVTIGGLAYFASKPSANPSGTQTQLKLAASVFPIADIARNVAGPQVDVVTILPPGASEHTFEPSIADQARLRDVEALFVVGLELDDWAGRSAQAANPNVEIVDMSEHVELRDYEAGLHDEHEEDGEDEDHAEEGYDPHYWLSLANAQLIAEAIKDKLIELDPDNAASYRENYAKYRDELEQLKDESRSKFAALEEREIITFHNAFAYFAAENELEIVAVVEEFPGKSPSAAYIQEVGAVIEAKNVRVLFKEPQLSDEVVEALARDYDATVATLDPIGGVDGRTSYIGLIRYNVDTVVAALNGDMI